MEPLDEIGKAVVKDAMANLENYMLTSNLKYLSLASDTLISLYWSRNYKDLDPFKLKEEYEVKINTSGTDQL